MFNANFYVVVMVTIFSEYDFLFRKSHRVPVVAVTGNGLASIDTSLAKDRRHFHEPTIFNERINTKMENSNIGLHLADGCSEYVIHKSAHFTKGSCT